MFFFFKQQTAYEMRISDWSSDVCSSDLIDDPADRQGHQYADRQCRDKEADDQRLLQCNHRCDTQPNRNHEDRRIDDLLAEIGRASCRERVCQDVEIAGVAVSSKKKKTTITQLT